MTTMKIPGVKGRSSLTDRGKGEYESKINMVCTYLRTAPIYKRLVVLI